MRKAMSFIYVIGMAAGGAALSGAMAGPFIKYDDIKGENSEQQNEPQAQTEKKKPKSKPQKGLLLPAVQKNRDVVGGSGGTHTPAPPPPPPPPPPPQKGKPQTAVGDVLGDGVPDNSNRRAVLTTRKSGEGQMKPQSQRPRATNAGPPAPRPARTPR